MLQCVICEDWFHDNCIGIVSVHRKAYTVTGMSKRRPETEICADIDIDLSFVDQLDPTWRRL